MKKTIYLIGILMIATLLTGCVKQPVAEPTAPIKTQPATTPMPETQTIKETQTETQPATETVPTPLVPETPTETEETQTATQPETETTVTQAELDKLLADTQKISAEDLGGLTE